MMVKICGITNLPDALAAAHAGATAIGFNFFPGSPRYLDPSRAAGIAAELPACVWKVGVFVNEARESIQSVAGAVGLDIVQLHGASTPPPGFRCWRACHVDDSFDLTHLDADAEACLLDAPFDGSWGGTGKSFDWRRASVTGRRIVVAGGLDESNVRAAIEQARPWGVDACSRLELRPGIKDINRMTAFIKAAHEAGERI